MAEKKKKAQKEVAEKVSQSCGDKFCPVHGIEKLKTRGRVFQGKVIRKLPGRIVIELERVLYFRKYERYEKRRTRLHARLPDCMENEVDIGDLVRISECRPLSKMIHFIVIEKIKSGVKNESN